MDTITITWDRYRALVETETRMDAYDAAGVDNWEGEPEFPDEDDMLDILAASAGHDRVAALGAAAAPPEGTGDL